MGDDRAVNDNNSEEQFISSFPVEKRTFVFWEREKSIESQIKVIISNCSDIHNTSGEGVSSETFL